MPLKPNYSFFAPLIFTPNGTLIDSENVSEQHEDVSLEPGQEVLLSCTPNYFKLFSADKTLRAKCKEETLLCKYNNSIKQFINALNIEHLRLLLFDKTISFNFVKE